MPPLLHHQIVTDKGAARPRAYALVVHGMLGSGANFRSFARLLVERRPEWGVVLVDLPQHGRSREIGPPFTVAAAAAHLGALAGKLAEGGVTPAALLGHSLGGKVVLAVRAAAPAWLRATWVLDAAPGPRPGLLAESGADTVAGVLARVGAVPHTVKSRAEFIASLQASGLSRAVGEWLAQSLEAREGGFTFPLDLGALRALLEDYAEVDLWPAVAAPGPGSLSFVVGGASHSVSDADRARLAATPGVELVVLPGAGHWVHVDALAELVDHVARGLVGVGA